MANNKRPINGLIPSYHMPPPTFSSERGYFPNMFNPYDNYGRYYPSFINQGVRPQSFPSYFYSNSVYHGQFASRPQYGRAPFPDSGPRSAQYSASKLNMPIKRQSQTKRSKPQTIVILDDDQVDIIPQTTQKKNQINQVKTTFKTDSLPTQITEESQLKEIKQLKDINQNLTKPIPQKLSQEIESLKNVQKQKQRQAYNINQLKKYSQYQNNKTYQSQIQQNALHPKSNDLQKKIRQENSLNSTKNQSFNIPRSYEYSNGYFNNDEYEQFMKKQALHLKSINSTNLNNSTISSLNNNKIISSQNKRSVSDQLQPYQFQQYRKYRDLFGIQPKFPNYTDSRGMKTYDQFDQMKKKYQQNQLQIKNKKELSSTYQKSDPSFISNNSYISPNYRPSYPSQYPIKNIVIGSEYQSNLLKNSFSYNNLPTKTSLPSQKNLFNSNQYDGSQNLTQSYRERQAYQIQREYIEHIQRLRKQQLYFKERSKGNINNQKNKQNIIRKDIKQMKTSRTQYENEKQSSPVEGTSLELIIDQKNQKVLNKYKFNQKKIIQTNYRQKTSYSSYLEKKKRRQKLQEINYNELQKTKKIRKLRSDKKTASEEQEKGLFEEGTGNQYIPEQGQQQIDYWTPHHKKIKDAVKKRQTTTQIMTGPLFQAEVPQFNGCNPTEEYKIQRINKRNDLLSRNYNNWR